jgi:hypothetical protein
MAIQKIGLTMTQLPRPAARPTIGATKRRPVRQSQIGDRVTARAEVRASDCQLLSVDVTSAGEMGKLLLNAFDVNGKARSALVQVLSRIC